MEYAVLKTGGKQYVVKTGDIITVEKMKDEHKKGDKVTFTEVLLVDDGAKTTIGTPLLSGKKVEGIVDSVGRAKKVEVVKYKAKSNYFKRRGHKQPYVKVRIESIA
jgi:large subunit ribosomal protein L21